MPWDTNAAVAYLQLHALPQSTGRCARWVREAVTAGGETLSPTLHARDMGFTLRASGFIALGEGTQPQAGDVAVIQPAPGHPDGHAAMYDGTHWISDFKQQHGLYPGPAYRSARPSYTIYRHQ